MQGELIEARLTHDVIQAFYTVYNHFGYGLHESIYMDALEIELTEIGHQVAREVFVPVVYKRHKLRSQRLDRVVDGRVVLEGKATEKLTSADITQVRSYLQVSPFKVGLLLHFGPIPSFKRLVDIPKRYFEPPGECAE